MLKSMLFGGTSGSGSWVLQFNEEGLILNDICIDKNGPLYVAGEAYRYFSTHRKVKNIFSARIENTGIVSWQNYFGDDVNNEDKQSENGHIAIINGEILVGGNEIVNNSLVGTQFCLYSVNGEKLGTKRIKSQKTKFGNISAIKPFGTHAYVCGDYLVEIYQNSSNIYLYDREITNYSPNKIVDVVVSTDSSSSSYRYLCVQDEHSNLFIRCKPYKSTGDSGRPYLIGRRDKGKVEGAGICVDKKNIFICGTLDGPAYTYTRGIVASCVGIDYIDTRWIQEISGNAHVYCRGISLDTDGNSYVVGDSSGLGFLIKLSLNGKVLLNIKITGDEYTVKSVKTDTDGNVYLLMSKYIVRLTKNDIESIITSPLSIGPLTFTKGSLNIGSSSSIGVTNSILSSSSNGNNYVDTSSDFISRKANLTSKLYKG